MRPVRPLILLLLTSGFALAQSNVTRYYGDECAVISKDVYVSPNGLTFLEFYDSIDAGGVISPGLMIQGTSQSDAANQGLQEAPMTPFVAAKAEGSNRLDLSTELSAAETPLTVWVKGQPCLLRLTVKPDLVGPQRYIIERSRPLPALSAPPSTPLPQTSAPPPVSATTPAVGVTTPPVGASSVPSPDASVSDTELAQQLDFKLVSVTAVSSGAANAFFTFTNHSERIIVLDGTRATFVQNGVRLPTKVRKEPLRGLVQPGETQVGYIVLDDAAPGSGELTWTLQEMGGETRKVVVRETVSVPVD